MSESFIIDRIESGFVVAETEDETMVNIPENLIKGDFKEGDILIKKDEFFKVDSDLTKKRKEEIDYMLKNMWQ